MSITISGISKHQSAILDKMWILDSEEEFNLWYDSLSENQRKEVISLREMLVLAEIDEHVDEVNDTSVALRMINKCR